MWLAVERPFNPSFFYFHHATPAGTFESGGDAAKTYYRKACGAAKVTVKDIPIAKESAVDIVPGKAACARLCGAPRAIIRKRVDRFLKAANAENEFESDEDWLAQMPVSLDP